MTLTHEDIQLLKSWGFKDEDMRQINEAAYRTKYTLGKNTIRRDEAIAALGREVWLSGIARSAFHYTAASTTNKGDTIFFNSRALFR